jgi:hypothetical protein
MSGGTARPVAQRAWKRWLRTSTSSTHARRAERTSGSAATRLFVRVSASGLWGNVKNSKWSLPVTSSSRRSSTVCSGCAASTPSSTNAGTARSVTAVTTPSAPTLTRAARHASGSSRSVTSTIDPSASTSSTACSPADRLGSRPPVPWVPVAVAPAIDCTSMSPRFSNANPSCHRNALSASSVIPPSTFTSPDAVSTSSTRSIRPSDSRVPSVRTAGLKECPAPATRTVRPARAARPTASETSAGLAGRTISAGAHDSSRAQLRQAAAAVIGAGP